MAWRPRVPLRPGETRQDGRRTDGSGGSLRKQRDAGLGARDVSFRFGDGEE